MNEDTLDYSIFIEKAVKDAMKCALKKAQEAKFGNFCFVFNVDTRTRGVRIPKYVKEQHPNELMLYLHYNFNTLKVRNNNFSIDLEFGNRVESITIPFNAINSFTDEVAGVELRVSFVDEYCYDYNDDYNESSRNNKKKRKKDNLIMFADLRK